MDSNIKLSNVIGAPFQQYVLDQFYLRAGKNSAQTRTLDEVLFIANKTAWVRVASSVNVISRQVKLKVGGVEKVQDIKMADVYKQLGVDYENQNYKNQDSLAKNWILEAGTSKQAGNGIELRYGVSGSNAEGFTNMANSSYGLGGTQELGYVPMPGLTSVTVETLGRLGSLRQASINFRVNNLNQLNVIEALYFRLGYSMILEWGHTQYYKNDFSFITNGAYGIGDPFDDKLRKEEVIQRINAKTREANGNYGGMYGIVTGFTWNATQDGGYDCTLKLIGHGAIMDSLKVNQSYTLPQGDIKEYKKQEQLLFEYTAKEKARLELLEAQANQPAPVAAPITYPEATNLEDLHNKIKDRGEAASFTLDDFTTRDGWPIPGANDSFKADSLNNFNPKLTTRGKNDFVIVPSFSTKDATVLDALKRSYGGAYINQGGTFIHLKYGGFSATMNTAILGYHLQYLTAADYVSDGYETTSYSYYDVYKIKGFLENRGVFPKTMLGALLLDAGSYATDGDSWSYRDVNLKMYDQKLTIVASNSAAVQVTVVEATDKTSAKYANGWFFKVSYSYPNVYFKPSPKDVVDSLEYYLGNNGNTIPVTNMSVFIKTRTANYQDLYVKGQFSVNVAGTTALFSDNGVTPSYNEGKSLYNANPSAYKVIDDNTQDRTLTLALNSNPITFEIETNDFSIFSNYSYNGTAVPNAGTETKVEEVKEEDKVKEVSQADTTQVESSEGFSSALQAMLTIVQTSAQAAALNKSGVVEHDITELTKKFYDNGALAGVLVKNGNKYETATPDLQAVKDGKFKLLNYAIKGFNAAIMADKSLEVYNNILAVPYPDLCTAYVIKYKMPGIEGVLGSVRSPTYISLGYLLAFLNNMCLIYDSTQSREFGVVTTAQTTDKRPYIYIDFNPKTNYCFTSPQQFTIDPTVCMITYNATKDEYGQVFPGGVTGDIAKNLDPAIFNPQTENKISEIFKKFPYREGRDGGSLMNILLNCQYLLDLCLQMQSNDPEHAVNLKPFLDQILIDVNKALGGVNSFRASYIDEANVVQIVDDQWVPSPQGLIAKQASSLDLKEVEAKKATDPKTSGELPLTSTIPSAEAPGQLTVVGTKSLTREFRFNTTISSKLASKIAISAQAEVGAVNSKDHSPYSHLNLYYEDRYSRAKEDPSKGAATLKEGGDKNTGRSTDQQVADLFNTHVLSIYSDFNAYSPKNIQAAKNYYLERMSKIKADDPLTSANPYISLELEMTLDGISGIIMGNAFTVPNDRLPYTYRGTNGTTKIAFIVTGLVHTIQNNEWLTKIKGQMIKLKNPVTIGTAAAQISGVQKARSLTTIVGTNVNRKNCGNTSYSGAPQVPEGESVNSQNFSTKYYPGFKFVKGTSDINLKQGSLTPITNDNEIQDDTTLNRFNIGKNSPTPTTFVIHHTGGYEKSAQDVYNVFYCSGNPAQYVVTTDGVIHRFMPDGAYSYHAKNHNTDSIGVEVVAYKESDINQAQIEAVARLAQYLGFKKSQLRYHGQYENRMNDEGTTIYNYIINNL